MHSVELGSLRPAKIKEVLVYEQVCIRGFQAPQFHQVISKTEIPGTWIPGTQQPTQCQGFCDEFWNNPIKWLLDVIRMLKPLADIVLEISRKEKQKTLTEIDFLLPRSAFLFSTKHRPSGRDQREWDEEGTVDWCSDPSRQVLSQSPSSHIILANNQHIFALNRCVLPCKH